MTRPRTERRRVAALDGLRGVAIAGVLAFHAGLLRGGFLGVSTFFTLSGFLVTRLLVAEVERTGAVDLRRFWAQRARRLVPAALACAFGVLLFAATVGTPSQLRSLRGDMVAALGQAANWRYLAEGQRYASRFADPSPLQHVWSLSIEEQFYLLLPLAVAAAVWAGGRRPGPPAVRRRLALGALAVAALGATVGAVVTPQHGYYDTITRLPELLVGVALAAWLGRDHGLRRAQPAVRVLRRLTPLALGAVAFAWWRADPTDRWLGRGGFLLNAGATAVLIVACHRRTRTARVLSLRPLAWLGRISYGVYLYHWPVFLWLTPQRSHLRGVPLLALRLAVTLTLAQLSWALLEQPVRRRIVLRGAAARRALVVAGVMVAVNLVLVTARPPEPALAFTTVRGEAPAYAPAATVPISTGSISTGSTSTGSTSTGPATADAGSDGPGAPPAPSEPTPTTTTTTTAPTPLRIMVVGDSIALTLAGGMIAAAPEHPSWRVYVDAESGCSLASGGTVRALGYEAPDPPKCAVRNAALAAHVVEFRPDVVLVLSCLWEVADRQLPGERRWRRPGDPAADAMVAAAVASTADAVTATGAHVGWLTCPRLDPVYHPENYMGPPPYPVAEPARIVAYNALVAGVLAGRPVTTVDLAAHLAAQPGGDLDPSRRPDGVHLSRPTAREVGAWAVDAVLAATTVAPAPHGRT